MPGAPLGGTRAQAVQRLQIGLSGLVAVVILIGLASVISGRAGETEKDNVPEAAASVEPEPTPTGQGDPLAQTGVVPDLPAEPDPDEIEAPETEAGGTGADAGDDEQQ